VFIQPATSNNSDSIKGGHTFLSEEGGQDVASDTADSMGGKDLDNVVCQAFEYALKMERSLHQGHHRSCRGT